MKRTLKKVVCAALIACGLVTLGGCGGDQSGVAVRGDNHAQEPAKTTNPDGQYKIYLITMDQGSNYWQLIDEGCREAVKDIGGIEYKWLAPKNHDAKEQGECVDKAVADGVDAIIIAAITPTDVNPNLDKADKAGIKIVYVDSAASYEGVATLITDNERAGKIAGETMRKALDEAGITSGTIGIYSIGKTQNAILRDAGFRIAFSDTAFTVAPTVFSDSTRQNIKDDVAAHPEYVGLFGTNGQMCQMVVEQVKESGTHQRIIGFDTADFTLAMIKEGVVYATMQQKPKEMGREGMEIAVKALRGEFTEKNFLKDMGVNVLTKKDV